MEWIKVATGLSPQSDIVVVYKKEDDSYEIAYKLSDTNSKFPHPSGFAYFDKTGKNIMEGLPVYAFMDINPFKDYELK